MWVKSRVERWISAGDAGLVAGSVTADISRQTSSRRTAVEFAGSLPSSAVVLDLGCGDGSSVAWFREAATGCRWLGVDIEESAEVNGRTRTDATFVTFDGTRLPLMDESCDLVYSHQVLEHVRHPVTVLREVVRVLRPGAPFIGSTSQLEPFHSRSFWNFTPYGLQELMMEAGFACVEFRPAIDGLTLTARRVFSLAGLAPMFSRFFERESPLNLALELSGRAVGLGAKERKLLKLLFAGHFVFLGFTTRA